MSIGIGFLPIYLGPTLTGTLWWLIPLLAEQGILTLKDAHTAAERTYYARLKYSAPALSNKDKETLW
ncbi:MAG: hypothetical protein HY331_11405 [Chloroflexi bacterium]|nr:hypothetical protein [Chloroflexota bacterium]